MSQNVDTSRPGLEPLISSVPSEAYSRYATIVCYSFVQYIALTKCIRLITSSKTDQSEQIIWQCKDCRKEKWIMVYIRVSQPGGKYLYFQCGKRENHYHPF